MCYIPFCQRCQEQLGRSEVAPPSWLRSECSGGSGHSLTPSENLRISTLHTQLQLQFDGVGDHLQLIQKGSGWNSLPCSKSTRLVHAVSQLSGCGIYQVLNALEKEATSDEWGTTSLSPARKRGRAQGTTRLSPARRRGRVAGIVESTVFSDVDSTKHGADASHRGLMGRSETDVAMAVATGAIGAEVAQTQVHGVRGKYHFQTPDNPEQVAIALVLGRALVFSLVHALPNRVFEGLVTQMAMANIKVGQKLDGSMMIKLFGFISAKTVVDLVRVRFWKPPHNLTCPSAFRLVWDGVTLRNGATVCITMVVFTDSEGLIRSEVV